MSLPASCPECRCRFTLPERMAGKKVRCSNCESVFEFVPVLREEITDEPAPRRKAGAARRASEDDRRPRKKAAGMNWLGVAFAGVAALLAIAFLVGAIVFMLKATRPVGPDLSQASAPATVPPPPPGMMNPVIGVPKGEEIPPVPFPAVDTTVPEDALAVESPPPPPGKDPADATAGGGDLSREARDAVKRSTVYIRVTQGDGGGSGSGFLGAAGAPNIVLTNAHVIGMLSADSPQPQKIEVVLNSGQKDEKTVPARILAVDRASDLAVLDIGRQRGLPQPLVVKSAANLGELDKVYTFGFPLGERLGKEITVRPTTVASLRKRDGVLHRIQVHGAMDPGNSGGPVVDRHGHVVGVAVSGILNRQINFAIPGDHVRSLLYGRVAGLTLGQPYQAGDKVSSTIRIEMLDPRRELKDLALELWTGDAPRGAPTRPAASAAPAAGKGDSPRQRFELTYFNGVARGSVQLPPLPAGKVYWVQPSWRRKSGEALWASALAWQPPPAVERKALALQPRFAAGQAERKVLLSVLNRVSVGADDESEVAVIGTQGGFRERVVAASDTGVSLALAYQSAIHSVVKEKKPEPSEVLGLVRSHLKSMSAQVKLDATGKITENRLEATAPPPVMLALNNFHEPLRLALEGTQLPLPNRTVNPLESWQAQTTLPVETPQRNQRIPIDLTCTFLGAARSGGREIAVIRLNGRVRDPRTGGKARGMMMVDVATGMVRDVKMNVDLDTQVIGLGEGGIQQVKVHCRVSIRLERTG